MASVSGLIQDLTDALGRQERDADLQAHANLLDKGKHVNQMLSEFDAAIESNPTGRLWLMYIRSTDTIDFIDPYCTYLEKSTSKRRELVCGSNT